MTRPSTGHAGQQTLWGILLLALTLLPFALVGCGDEGGDGESETTNQTATFLSTTGPTPTPSPTTTTRTTTTGTTGTVAPRSRKTDAQFLIQATFGPTTKSLEELASKADYGTWIRDQMALPVGSHRSYYRARVNPHRGLGISEPPPVRAQSTCSAGSLWHQFAFTVKDIGLPITSDGTSVYVNGTLRTHLDPTYAMNGIQPPDNCTDHFPNWLGSCDNLEWRRWQCKFGEEYWTDNEFCQTACWNAGFSFRDLDCSVGWPSFTYSGYVCEVDEKVGGVVLFDTNAECTDNGGEQYRHFTAMQNPALYIQDEALVAESDALFEQTKFSQDAMVMSESPASCGHRSVEFILVGNRTLRYYPRFYLAENSLENPASEEVAPESGICTHAPRTFLNEESCQMKPNTCGFRGGVVNQRFDLNEGTLAQLHDISGRYVYYITGLRAESTPCGTLSRWVQLNCGVDDCTATSLSSGDKTAIKTALEEQTGQIRDVTPLCSRANVPAGAKVQADGETFHHVHLNEFNVYDFTAWASIHPGGSSVIAQWATGSFELQWQSDHPMERWYRSTTRAAVVHVGTMWSSVSFTDIPTELRTPEIAAALFNSTTSVPYAWACGSPGETASEPELGHHFSMILATEPTTIDRDIEKPYPRFQTPADADTKTTVWTMKALYGEDQLRQRLAWALSQIFVVGTPNFGWEGFNEIWMTYYDIFTRNAFGKVRDVLREVTYSPLMGNYLSFIRSWSLDADGNYPDENYAREIMQLFSIGIWMLNPDGSHVLDGEGNPIPSYSNDEIMEFARVFTGFDYNTNRANTEAKEFFIDGTMIDPMQMHGSRHDVYPKMDLYGGYLGDNYPICSDLPKDAFLHAGAVYELEGIAGVAAVEVLNLTSDSPLFAALCGSATPPCTFANKVTLPSTVACIGEECGVAAENLQIVRVDSVYYRYVPPTCANLYFFSDGMLTVSGGSKPWYWWTGGCANPSWPVAGASCCKGCTNIAPDDFFDDGYDCSNASWQWMSWACKNNDWWIAERYCAQRCYDEGYGYLGQDCSVGGYDEARGCSFPRERMGFVDAEDKCHQMGMEICWRATGDGCRHEDEDAMQVWINDTCTVNISIQSDGKVRSMLTSKSTNNPIRVVWEGGMYPTSSSFPEDLCGETDVGWMECRFQTEIRAVFTSLPSSSALAQLKVGAHRPTASCLHCSGSVKSYSNTGSIDVETIFEHNGKYYRNMESRVVVGDYSFRNPPTFMLPAFPTDKDALAEVEALLDHLSTHPNVAPFMSRILIQRFVSSTPSPSYVEAVAEAFTTGTYDGETYSGEYGDLGATIAAILLHPEARGASSSPTTTGKLREPVVKLMHLMRAMEFVDKHDREIVIQDIDARWGGMSFKDVIGQWPYLAPRVFNFYTPDYRPPEFVAAGIYAPEFEIFTPPWLIGWLNGVHDLIETGLNWCEEGFGMVVPSCTTTPDYNGDLTFNVSGTVDERIDELDVLLTGGRLGPSKDVVRTAYENAEQGKEFIAAQRAIMMTPEFHTLGEINHVGERAEDSEEQDAVDSDDYKAFVMLFLRGGVDSFNMLMPLNCDLVDEYLQVRTTVSIDPNTFIPISAQGQVCPAFGLHAELPFLQTLYNDGDLAFAANVGNLVEPVGKDEIYDSHVKLCRGLYSHADQVLASQSLLCQSAAADVGFGGLIGDVLKSKGFATQSYSIAGQAVWSTGRDTPPVVIHDRNGAVYFDSYAQDKEMLWNVSKKKVDNVYAEAFNKKQWSGIQTMQDLKRVFDNATVGTDFDLQGEGDNILARQLYQVAKAINTRHERGVQRDLFYVELDGFDHHIDEELASLARLYRQINYGLQAFVAEMKAEGVFDKVVIASGTDFARTLTSNGEGTDHAWAGHNFVIGGNIQGGHIFNEYPTSLLEGSEQDLGRGRFVPKYPLENMYAPIAEWMGLSASELTTPFRNLGNFNQSRYIISKSSLFQD